MKITPQLQLNVVDCLRSDPVDGVSRACLLLLLSDLADEGGMVDDLSYEQLAETYNARLDDLLSRVLELARPIEAPAA